MKKIVILSSTLNGKNTIKIINDKKNLILNYYQQIALK